ncbi:MAG: 4Fe-4S dicluster domain-containing protein [Clostridiales bacterium]|jgi:[FeFe] hydrogenase (group B1/B3)|nr:4Fe-4S dicluster domain-containing protein [Clostridiales bacterium]
MRKFDTKVQDLKYKVLRKVAELAWKDQLLDNLLSIPQMIVPGNTPTMRCCVYKERAIISERVKLAMGGDKGNPNVIEVIGIACDDCPMGGYEVTGACRGCLAHRCEDACKRGAINFDHHYTASIDKSKCIECGLCAKVCPYSAIINFRRPCEQSCKAKAISVNGSVGAQIDASKCIWCGACVYQCPWGAVMDKSYILSAIDILKQSDGNKKYKVFAVAAPSVSSQFNYAKLGQVISGLKALGFFEVIEGALGADMVAYAEAAELHEKGFLTSSCCPAFVQFIKNQFPDLIEFVSHNLPPGALISKKVKESYPDSKIIFIGPCTAKKMEFQREEVKPYIDSVITFEELAALFDSREIDISALPEEALNSASYFGRIFARSGGLSSAVSQGLKEQGFDNFDFNPVPCDGIEACRSALLKKSKNVLPGNFIEGMACVDGCIGGAGCLTHGPKSKSDVDRYGKEAIDRTISDAISMRSLPTVND